MGTNCAQDRCTIFCLFLPGFVETNLKPVQKCEWFPLTKKFLQVLHSNTCNVKFVGKIFEDTRLSHIMSEQVYYFAKSIGQFSMNPLNLWTVFRRFFTRPCFFNDISGKDGFSISKGKAQYTVVFELAFLGGKTELFSE